jgi:hypothetical protein
MTHRLEHLREPRHRVRGPLVRISWPLLPDRSRAEPQPPETSEPPNPRVRGLPPARRRAP